MRKLTVKKIAPQANNILSHRQAYVLAYGEQIGFNGNKLKFHLKMISNLLIPKPTTILDNQIPIS
ncbi:hypothetical protein PEPS_43290 (plasmid) [Persicobacter psychrovividus]|uniref:Uncharacterized protein n=1 Tax=Persicobacter psychrovividus TaxID=387638 RepID=A0ABM7VM13_9BACT|nr:hypothetical protein PEPS_43290 [Persicobacter psychrovividus]